MGSDRWNRVEVRMCTHTHLTAQTRTHTNTPQRTNCKTKPQGRLPVCARVVMRVCVRVYLCRWVGGGYPLLPFAYTLCPLPIPKHVLIQLRMIILRLGYCLPASPSPHPKNNTLTETCATPAQAQYLHPSTRQGPFYQAKLFKPLY